MIRVLLVDDHPLFREGLAAALVADPDLRVVGGVGTAEAALDLVPRVHPRVAIVDVQLPGMNGYDACARLQRNQQVAVVLVTSTPTGIAVRRGITVGCAGFVGKAAPPSTFREAVRAVASRRSFIPGLRGATLHFDMRRRGGPRCRSTCRQVCTSKRSTTNVPSR